MPAIDLSGATSDSHLVSLWLAARPESTRRVYEPVVLEFLATLAGREGGLKTLTAAEVIEWAETLVGEPATRARKVSTVKSLLSFAWRTGYCIYNVGRVLLGVPIPSKVSERILEEPEVKSLMAGASEGRDRAFVRLMYATGARVSELCKLRWVDMAQPGRVSVVGKGSKTRTLVVPQKILDEVFALKPAGAALTDYVFTSKRSPGRALDPRDAREIIYRARDAAGMTKKVCCHALRHSHATHSLDRGCKIHVLQQSLGHSNISTTSIYLHVRPNQGSAQFLDL
jgi:integrase/recombinase XerD